MITNAAHRFASRGNWVAMPVEAISDSHWAVKLGSIPSAATINQEADSASTGDGVSIDEEAGDE